MMILTFGACMKKMVLLKNLKFSLDTDLKIILFVDHENNYIGHSN